VCRSWYTFTNTTTQFTITVTKTGGVQFMNILADEFNNVDSANPVDTQNSTSGTSGTPAPPAVTPAANNELVWTACNDNLTAVPAGYTQGSNDGASDLSAFLVLVNTGGGVSQNPAFTTAASTTWNAHIALFNPITTNSTRVPNTVRMRARSIRY
jgi:hypothetical protein